MLRSVAQRSLQLQISRLPRRYMSSEGKPRGRRIGRKLFWLLTGTAATTGGVLVYASKDERLRALIEQNIPNSKPCIDAAGSYSDTVVEYYKTISPSGDKPFSLPNVSWPQMPDISWPKMPEFSWPQISLPDFSWPQVSMPSLSMPEWLKDLKPGKGSTETPASAILEKKVPAKKSVDMLLSVAVGEIGHAVRETKDFVDALCNDVLGKTTIALGPSKDGLRMKRMAKVEALVRELKEDISKALADEQTTDKEHLHDIQRKLDTALRSLNLATLEAEAFRLYVQHYPENLQKELAAAKSELPEEIVMPLEKNNEARLTDKDMNQFIALGYRKLKSLQDKLERYDVAAVKSVQTALESQRGEVEKIFAEKFASDLTGAERQIKAAKAEELLEVERKLEAAHKEELARQKVESSQHLQDVLESQERHLRAKFESSVQEVLALERVKQQKELASLVARVSAIRQILSDRAEVDRLSSKSHQLWIATQALHDELFSGDPSKRAVTVKPMLDQITSSFGNEPYVATLVSQFDNEGQVLSQASLNARFEKVRRVCRRVSTVPYPPTFTAYFWSYVRSMFIIDPPPLPIFVDQEGSRYIDTSKPDTLAILSTAQHLLDNNELELCVRLMNQLSGEARQVASDWLDDARRLLEFRQAANGLLAFAAANSAVGFLTYQGVN